MAHSGKGDGVVSSKGVSQQVIEGGEMANSNAAWLSWPDSEAFVERASQMALCLVNLIVGFGLGYLVALQKNGRGKDVEIGRNGEVDGEIASVVVNDEDMNKVEESGGEVDSLMVEQVGVSGKGGEVFKVTSLYVYPIKACGGVEVDCAKVTDRGLENDRLFMIVDFTGRSVTQKKYPTLTLVKPRIEGDVLVITAPGMKVLRHAVKKWGTKKKVVHMKDTCEGIDQGDVAGSFFDEFLSSSNMRLVRMREGFKRKVENKHVKPGLFETSFSDGWPYLLANEASLGEVSKRVGRELEMWRFRPNVIVGGGTKAFEEDGWKRLEVGENVEFELTVGCIRCKVVTVDLETGSLDSENEPTETLKRFRSFGKTVVFGKNMVATRNARGRAEIKVGDVVKVTETLTEVPVPTIVPNVVEDGKARADAETI